jgi:hypothetical protein
MKCDYRRGAYRQRPFTSIEVEGTRFLLGLRGTATSGRRSRCSARRLGEARSDTDGNWWMRSRRVLRRDGHGVAWAADAVAAAARWPCRLEASRRVVRAAGARLRPTRSAHGLRRPIDQDSVLVEELQPGTSIVTQRRVCAGLESTELKSRKYTSDRGAAHVMANAHTTCDRVSRLTILVFA